MPRAEDEAIAVATRADGEIDMDVFLAEYRRGLAERHERLMHDARSAFRAEARALEPGPAPLQRCRAWRT